MNIYLLLIIFLILLLILINCFKYFKNKIAIIMYSTPNILQIWGKYTNAINKLYAKKTFL